MIAELVRFIAGVVDWTLSPLNWLLMAMLLAVAGWRLRNRMRSVVLAISLGLAVTAFAVSTPVMSNVLARLLESGIPVAASCTTRPPDVVVVLSGGVDRLPRHAYSSGVLSATSRRRIERGVAYWQEDPSRIVVMTGGRISSRRIPISALMHDYARRLGVPDAAMRLESRSQTTWENARFVADMAPAVPRRIALATSAMHMRRSVMAFEAAGFEVCPLPADYRAIRASLPWGLVPDVQGLEKADAALHEFIGTLHYRLLRIRHPPD